MIIAYNVTQHHLSFECICFLDPFTPFRAQTEKLFYSDTGGIVTPQTVKEGGALSMNLKNRQLTKI